MILITEFESSPKASAWSVRWVVPMSHLKWEKKKFLQSMSFSTIWRIQSCIKFQSLFWKYSLKHIQYNNFCLKCGTLGRLKGQSLAVISFESCWTSFSLQCCSYDYGSHSLGMCCIALTPHQKQYSTSFIPYALCILVAVHENALKGNVKVCY